MTARVTKIMRTLWGRDFGRTDFQNEWAPPSSKTVLDIFSEPGAKSLITLHDGELRYLKEECSPPPPLANYLVQSANHADCLGLNFNSPLVVNEITDLLRERYQINIKKIPTVYKGVFRCNPDLLGQLANKKRVLWVTSDAEKIVKRMNDPAFRDFYGLHGIVDNYYVNARPGDSKGWRGHPASGSMEESFVEIQERLFHIPDFDLAFVGVGPVGKCVCHHIKIAFGKTAIDIGVMMSALCGRRNRGYFKVGGNWDFMVWDPENHSTNRRA